MLFRRFLCTLFPLLPPPRHLRRLRRRRRNHEHFSFDDLFNIILYIVATLSSCQCGTGYGVRDASANANACAFAVIEIVYFSVQ